MNETTSHKICLDRKELEHITVTTESRMRNVCVFVCWRSGLFPVGGAESDRTKICSGSLFSCSVFCRTPLGRARAWLRLALMQKRLADYLRLLITRKDLLRLLVRICRMSVLSDFYEDSALMLEEEGAVIVGLLVGLNVIDANLCVKGEDLDSQVGVIDFSMYLKNDMDDYRSEERYGRSPSPLHAASESHSRVWLSLFFLFFCFHGNRNSQIASILDQKNYVEELNRQLNSTVHGLHSRVDSLEKSNSKLIEELAIAKNNIIKLQEENQQLRSENNLILMKAQHHLEPCDRILTFSLQLTQGDTSVERDTYKQSRQGLDEMYNEAQRQLKEECQLRQVRPGWVSWTR
ncbi:hypothetical protein CCH79_00010525 [Gambusia affinis]|uniref:RUN domain-containing protein n=1 Tax=Gambusia affinis TaxID=33528 RepID=A0A315V151_GAMAF|nr:hypothetical protein CCH79_00010525 [Gambusia affinis]